MMFNVGDRVRYVKNPTSAALWNRDFAGKVGTVVSLSRLDKVDPMAVVHWDHTGLRPRHYWANLEPENICEPLEEWRL